MGTRHLIEVKLNNEIKVAQYGQWDGYWVGQGADIAKFINEEMDLEKFKSAVSSCTFLTNKELKELQQEIDEKNINWTKKWPWLSRDAGSKILKYIQDSDGLKLKNDQEFKNDGLFCEFYYLINLDDETVTCGNITLPFKDWTVVKMKEIELSENKE